MGKFNPQIYWERRYRDGRDSGEGSRGEFAEAKARFLNEFIERNNIHRVVDYGCGDGQVLSLLRDDIYYFGVDVAPTMVQQLRSRFPGRNFATPDKAIGTYDLAISADVLLHFPDDGPYWDYLHQLFDFSTRWVVIYGTNYDGGQTARHVRRRQFTQDIADKFPDWTCVEAHTDPETPGWYVYERIRDFKLSASVMAHESRKDLVPPLLDRLGLSASDVSWDKHNDRWDTGRRAWEMADTSATHHIVIQDDAVVCSDLLPALELALSYTPQKSIMCPYIGAVRPMPEKIGAAVEAAEYNGANWIVMRALMWGVGILAPVSTVPKMLKWCDRQSYPNYDRRVGRYYLDILHWDTWYPYPTLMDHRDDIPSLCGHGSGRVARNFVGEDYSALSSTWGGPQIYMSHNPRHQAVDYRSGYSRGYRPVRTIHLPEGVNSG